MYVELRKRWDPTTEGREKGSGLSPKDGFDLDDRHQRGNEECHFILVESYSGGTGSGSSPAQVLIALGKILHVLQSKVLFLSDFLCF